VKWNCSLENTSYARKDLYKLVCMQNRRYSTGISRSLEEKQIHCTSYNIKVLKQQGNMTKICFKFLKILLQQITNEKQCSKKRYP